MTASSPIDMHLLYTFLLYTLQPLVWLRLLWRSRNAPAYRQRWLERYGFIPKHIASQDLVIHCVSVGETRAALPLIRALRQTYPHLAIAVTTTTRTGSEQARAVLGESVQVLYLPYDLPGALNRFLDHLRPNLMIILEKELWPNLLYALHQRQIPVVIANATISECSFKGYQKVGKLVSKMMQHITLVAAQHQQAGDRFIALGLSPQRLVVTGNLKFDVVLTPILAEQAALLKKTEAAQRPVWIAASTHPGEEQIILTAHQKLLQSWPDLLLLLAPRHPERFISVFQLTQNFGLRATKRSDAHTVTAQTHVLVCDTMGELMLLYGIADIAFVGGSLVPQGGHNPLEPAAHALPILMGPHHTNCQIICQQLQAAGGLTIVYDSTSLVSTLTFLLSNKGDCRAQGNNALQLFSKNRGAVQRLLQQLHPYLPARGHGC